MEHANHFARAEPSRLSIPAVIKGRPQQILQSIGEKKSTCALGTLCIPLIPTEFDEQRSQNTWRGLFSPHSCRMSSVIVFFLVGGGICGKFGGTLAGFS